MSLSSIARAAADQHLIDRVSAAANQVAQSDEDKANTVLGQSLINGTGMGSVMSLMWPVAVATEASYEYACNVGKGAPGYDKDIITDAEIHDAVLASWPMTRPFAPPT